MVRTSCISISLWCHSWSRGKVVSVVFVLCRAERGPCLTQWLCIHLRVARTRGLPYTVWQSSGGGGRGLIGRYVEQVYVLFSHTFFPFVCVCVSFIFALLWILFRPYIISAVDMSLNMSRIYSFGEFIPQWFPSSIVCVFTVHMCISVCFHCAYVYKWPFSLCICV